MQAKSFSAAFSSAVLLMTLSATATAQSGAQAVSDFPNKPIRIVVPYPPGAINDNLARVISQRMSETFKQTVIVENKPGAGTIIGTDFVAKSAPDGYTILLMSSANAVNPGLHPTLPYDPVKAFAPLSLAITAPYVLVVHPSVQAKSLKEFIALAKAKPGSLTFASSGNGSANHLMGEMLQQHAKVDFLHVPYKGMAPALNELIGGQTNFLLGSYSTLAGHINAGRLRPLAVSGKKRIASMPDVPTIAESGYPDYDANTWIGFAVPAGTPRPIVDKLSREIVRIMRSPDVSERYRSEAAEVAGSTPEQLAAFLAADTARWAAVIKAGNVKPD